MYGTKCRANAIRGVVINEKVSMRSLLLVQTYNKSQDVGISYDIVKAISYFQ